MADSKITALTAETAPVGADLIAIVDDVAGTPVTKKATLTNLAASAPFSTMYATFIETTTLTDKTSYSGTSTLEQWGTEEALLAQASAPATAKVWAVLTGTARNLDAATRGGEAQVEISLDGGSTWTAGSATYYEILAPTGQPACGVSAQHVRSGAVTGSVQARVRAQSFSATTGPDMIRGVITMHVIAA